jgi:hypothetical protein
MDAPVHKSSSFNQEIQQNKLFFEEVILGIFNRKKRLAAILNSAIILNFCAWKHFFLVFSSLKSLRKCARYLH